MTSLHWCSRRFHLGAWRRKQIKPGNKLFDLEALRGHPRSSCTGTLTTSDCTEFRKTAMLTWCQEGAGLGVNLNFGANVEKHKCESLSFRSPIWNTCQVVTFHGFQSGFDLAVVFRSPFSWPHAQTNTFS